MKKRIVGLMLLGLIAVAGPAQAQLGTADPLGLISIGAVVPFVGSPGNLAFLELASPVGNNGASPSASDSPGDPIHFVFFRADCSRGSSVNLPMTRNDVAFLNVGSIAPFDGLIVIGSSFNNLTLEPLFNPIHVRVHWASVELDAARILEPIIVLNANDPFPTWSPLRTAATFFAPFESSGLQTTIYFVCPSITITGCEAGSGPAPCDFDSGGVSALDGFAPPIDLPSARPIDGDPDGILRGVIYNDDEIALRDITTTCNCFTARSVLELDLVYGSAAEAPNGTYTELQGGSDGFRSFTGYRAINVGSGVFDDFGRLSNGGSVSIIDGFVIEER